MLTTYLITDAGQMKQWDAFVASHPKGTVFHSSPWLKCIHHTYRYQPFLYVSRDNRETIDGVFPCFYIKSPIMGRRLVSIPFSDYGGPLFMDADREYEQLARIIRDKNNGFRLYEIRSSLNPAINLFSPNNYLSHVLELDSQPEIVMKNVDRKTIRYSIRKAKKAGVEIERGDSMSDVKKFYDLNLLTRKKHGLPPQPYVFFKNIYKLLIETGHAFLMIAYLDSKAIGAGLFLKFQDTLYYKYNASDPSFLSKVSPNHLLTSDAIEWACLQGFKYFDFGRTYIANQGLARYKEMWGARAAELPYHYYPLPRTSDPGRENGLSYQIVTNICRRLPPFVLKSVGARLYKHMG